MAAKQAGVSTFDVAGTVLVTISVGKTETLSRAIQKMRLGPVFTEDESLDLPCPVPRVAQNLSGKGSRALPIESPVISNVSGHVGDLYPEEHVVLRDFIVPDLGKLGYRRGAAYTTKYMLKHVTGRRVDKRVVAD